MSGPLAVVQRLATPPESSIRARVLPGFVLVMKYETIGYRARGHHLVHHVRSAVTTHRFPCIFFFILSLNSWAFDTFSGKEFP